MMDAFASIISNNLNSIMKQLTLISILLMIPTLIASYYGMNVPNFLENSKLAFLVIIIGSLIFGIISIIIIKKRKDY